MNKYCINYTIDGHYTKHCFNSLKELKKILSSINGTAVEYKFECNTKKIVELCINHNELASTSIKHV